MLALLALLAVAWGHTTVSSGRWVVEHWTVDDGLPLSHFMGGAVSPDGTLWLSSYDGLVSFDGERVQVSRPADLAGLPSSRLIDLDVGSDGTLWLTTERGDLVRVADGAAQSWSREALGDRARKVTLRGGKLWALGDHQFWELLPEGPSVLGDPAGWGAPLDQLHDMVVDDRGDHWLVSDDAVVHLDRAGRLLKRYDAHEVFSNSILRSVAVSPSGVAVAIGAAGIWQISGDRVTPLPSRGEGAGVPLFSAYALPDGSMKLLGEERAWRLNADGSMSQMAQSEAESWREYKDGRDTGPWSALGGDVLYAGEVVLETAYRIVTLIASPQGVWVVTLGDGIYLVRPAPVRVEARSDEGAHGVLISPHGERIVIDLVGIARLTPELPVIPIAEGGVELPAPYWLDTAVQDASGRIWVGGRTGICVIEGERCLVPTRVSQIQTRPLVLDQRGSLWVDTPQGLQITAPGTGPDSGFVQLIPHSSDEIGRVGALLPDGSVMVAFENLGLRRYAQGTTTAWTRADGLGLDVVRSLYVDASGLLWIATVDGGLCRLDLRGAAPDAHPAPTCLTRSRGLPTDTIHSVTQDDQGRMWMSSNQGIFYVTRREIDAALDDPAAPLSPLMLSERDGMPNREANGTAWPTVSRSADGALYYPTQAGVVSVDPAAFPLPSPPEVRIEQVRVGGTAVDHGADLKLSADQRDVAISWTSPEYRWPEQLQFRYRLRGYSDAWSPLRSDRETAWTNLPPGDYTFEVEAALGGSWSAQPTRFSFTRAPAFVETAWFPISVGAAAMAVAGLLAWRRSLQKQRQIVALEEEVRRRTAVLAERNAELAQTNGVIAAQASRLAELDTLKSAFVSNLSHELRTPLTLVLGPLEELLERPDGLNDRQKATVSIAHRNGERLRELVQQLFDVARLETGGLPLRARPQDLGALASRVVARFTRAALAQGITLTVEAGAGPSLWLDADLIDKVLSNLIGNALKFTPTGGRVCVQVTPPAEGAQDAVLTVTDTGVGIAPDEQRHIFERFYQVDSAGGRPHAGAGIGLSLARDLVELHGGAISVESAPGRGSAFRVTLPMGAAHLRPEEVDISSHGTPVGAPAPAAAAPAPAPEAERLEAASVLIVEDHADMRAYLATHFAERFEVRTAENGREALEAMRASRPDVVVSDVMMPELDGISMCRALRADATLQDLPVILISAKGADADRRAGLEVANAWYSKPFRMRELLDEASRLAPPPPPVDEGAPVDGPVQAPTESDQRLLDRLRREIVASLSDPELSVATLARRMAMSRRQLLREVSRLTGQPVVAYIQRTRMDAARDLLRQPQAPSVSEVAQAVGMNRAYFSRLYSAWHGRAPSEERHTAAMTASASM